MSVFVTFPFFRDKLGDGVGGLRRGGFFVDVVANVGISVIDGGSLGSHRLSWV